LWGHDAGLWTGKDEAGWLGWLGIVGEQQDRLSSLRNLSDKVGKMDFSHILLLGMGGSSLGPEVLAKTFGHIAGRAELLVLDSTDPAQIRSFANRIDPARTLFVVSSKSGTTLEPNILKQYFFERAKEAVGAEHVASRFIAVTDPGSQLQSVAARDGFSDIALGKPDIGGRYSVLSDFGIVPGAVMGLDLGRLLSSTQNMVRSCAADVPPAENPGVMLGAILGVLGREGHDKITIVASPGIEDFGAWLEQLLAESTGKQGKGLIPLADEPLGSPDVYGQDRLFVYLRLAKEVDKRQDDDIAALEGAGHPVVRISITDRYQLGQEFFRWEIATAVAGAILKINPFDQPDVEASKVETRKLTTAYEKTGKLPPEEPVLEEHGIKVFADTRNREVLAKQANATLAGWIHAHFDRLGGGDYCALLAYIDRNTAHIKALQEIRRVVRDRKQVATCVGFGPRFLHSTGQAYKGGPNTGVFLQITCDDAADLGVPGESYSFGIVKAAQARGDFEVLAARQRRLLRIHLGSNVDEGLSILAATIRQALA
jgi:transaldolase/glucose-6-phosphate isomerase